MSEERATDEEEHLPLVSKICTFDIENLANCRSTNEKEQTMSDVRRDVQMNIFRSRTQSRDFSEFGFNPDSVKTRTLRKSPTNRKTNQEG